MEHVVQLHRIRNAIEELDASVYVLGFEPEDRARAWMQQAGVQFPFLLDPLRRVYRDYELDRSLIRAWHPRTLLFYFKRALRGKMVPVFRADPSQLGGDFIIDRGGTIRLAYRSETSMDRPPVDLLLETLKGLEPIGNLAGS